MSYYFHYDIYDFLADNIVSIKVTFYIPIILLGDFYSRTGIATDLNICISMNVLSLKIPNLILLKELTEINI